MIDLCVVDGVIHARAPSLNEEQQPCLASHEELAVSAGAGAGKTFTLAARFVVLHQRIISGLAGPSGRGDPQAVLVLTFSERAAEEMRERCFLAVSAAARAFAEQGTNLAGLGVAASEVARQRRAWERLRDGFAGASISTFHGFCSRILREFPAECETPPGFGVLDEPSAGERVARAVDGALAVWLQDRGDDQQLLLRTFATLSGLRSALISVVSRRGELAERLEPWTHRSADADHALQVSLLTRSPVQVVEAREFLTDQWLPTLQQLVRDGPSPPPKWTAGALLAAIVPLPTPFEPTASFLVLDRYRAAIEQLTTATGPRQMDRAIGGSKTWPRSAARPELLSRLTSFQSRADDLNAVPGLADCILAGVLPPLLCLANTCITVLRTNYRDEGVVDFCELLVRAGGATANPRVQDTLQDRHRFVMVDEFQDTDALQWRIVSALGRPGGQPVDRIFVVGDIKQAIYGFRGGDVVVFEAARRSLCGQQTLARNHRSVPGLITFYNELFAAVLGAPDPGRPAWEAPFTALYAHRTQPEPTGPAVTFATHDGEDGEEVRWIAQWIREALDPLGPLGHLGLGDRGRYKKAPIAILLRTRTKLPLLEEALRRAHVAAQVDGGIGFWDRPEVSDLVDLLHALTRGDTISRVSALRSPLFGLDDDTLVALGGGWEPAVVLGADQARLVNEARESWTRLEAASRGQRPAALIELAIRETHADFSGSAQAPGGRGAANLARLLTLADEWENDGGSLDSLVDRWVRARGSGQRDAEAAIAGSDARVCILTVHASKGLEWPVVIVPFLQMLPAQHGGVHPLRTPGGDWDLAFDVVHPHTGAMLRPARVEALKEHAAVLEDAEARRLLYVACTRAEDHLLLTSSFRSASPNGAERRPPERSWLAHLWPWQAGHRASPPDWVQFVAISPPAPVAVSLGASPSPFATLPALLEPAPSPRRIVVLPSQLAGWADELQPTGSATSGAADVLSAPPAPTEGPGEPDGHRRHVAMIIAATVGTVVHGLIEDDLIADPHRAKLRWNQAAREAGLSPEVITERWGVIAAQMRKLAGSADVTALLGQKQYRELKFRYQRGGDRVILQGAIDLLGRDPLDGAWIVVDHKTVREPAPTDGTRAEGATAAGDLQLMARYRWQLLAYSVGASRVLEAHGHDPVKRGALLLTRSARILRLPDWTDDDRAELDALLERISRR